jgi:hypothetical protein
MRMIAYRKRDGGGVIVAEQTYRTFHSIIYFLCDGMVWISLLIVIASIRS